MKRRNFLKDSAKEIQDLPEGDGLWLFDAETNKLLAHTFHFGSDDELEYIPGLKEIQISGDFPIQKHKLLSSYITDNKKIKAVIVSDEYSMHGEYLMMSIGVYDSIGKKSKISIDLTPTGEVTFYNRNYPNGII